MPQDAVEAAFCSFWTNLLGNIFTQFHRQKGFWEDHGRDMGGFGVSKDHIMNIWV